MTPANAKLESLVDDPNITAADLVEAAIEQHDQQLSETGYQIQAFTHPGGEVELLDLDYEPPRRLIRNNNRRVPGDFGDQVQHALREPL